MATRHWTLHFDGETHTVRLEHGYWSGSRQIWVDDKLVEKSRKFSDYGSKHPINIGQHHGELGITTNGLTYDYYLSIDGILCPSEEDLAKGTRPGRVVRSYFHESEYWQELERLTGMSGFPVADDIPGRKHRLVGRIEGHYVVVRDGGVVVSFGPDTDIKHAFSQIKADPAIAQLHFAGKLKECLHLQERIAHAVLKYDPTKISAAQFAQEVLVFVKLVTRWTHPHPTHRCDMWSCKKQTQESNTLVLINDIPHLLCDDCVKTLPQLGESIKRDIDTQPEHFWRGTAAALGSSVIYGLVWAVVWTLLNLVKIDTFGTVFFMGVFLATVWAMDKVGAKSTLKGLFVALIFSILGVVIGVYGYLALTSLVSGKGLLDALVGSYSFLLRDSHPLRLLIIFDVLIALMAILDYVVGRRGWMKKLANLPVEIVGDINVLNEMNR
jgi:hypothetical protein